MSFLFKALLFLTVTIFPTHTQDSSLIKNNNELPFGIKAQKVVAELSSGAEKKGYLVEINFDTIRIVNHKDSIAHALIHDCAYCEAIPISQIKKFKLNRGFSTFWKLLKITAIWFILLVITVRIDNKNKPSVSDPTPSLFTVGMVLGFILLGMTTVFSLFTVFYNKSIPFAGLANYKKIYDISAYRHFSDKKEKATTYDLSKNIRKKKTYFLDGFKKKCTGYLLEVQVNHIILATTLENLYRDNYAGERITIERKRIVYVK